MIVLRIIKPYPCYQKESLRKTLTYENLRNLILYITPVIKVYNVKNYNARLSKCVKKLTYSLSCEKSCQRV